MAPNLIYLAESCQERNPGRVRVMRISVSGGTSQLVSQEEGVEDFQCAQFPSTLCIFSLSSSRATSHS
jgi:hypothetical protein